MPSPVSKANDSLPRPEHPRPQFRRDSWVNLNGEWSCELDVGQSGSDRGLAASTGFDTPIVVPFCPESELSRVGWRDFIPAIWYHRVIEIPAEWAGRRVLLHFGGVDYESEAYLDGELAGRHYGGAASFAYDVTRRVRPGDVHHLVVHARDDVRSPLQPSGKQSPDYHSRGCHYTRVTGIWQTVWLEAVDVCGLRNCTRILPDVDGKVCHVLPSFHALEAGLTVGAELREGERTVCRCERAAGAGMVLSLPVEEDMRLWRPGDPFLYDLRLEVRDAGGQTVDAVQSYVGMRKIHLEGDRVFLNNEPLYQRLVLDQGYYKQGVWTAPTDADLKRDIELAQAAGFNGARLHQKAFEERFHYWADRLGHLTWAEAPSWGLDPNRADAARNFLAEWRELVQRDRNHPSIIAWTPLNETGDVREPRQHRRFHIDCYELTHALDGTRPVNDASGYVHARTDLWTVHAYTQDPEQFKAQLETDEDGEVIRNAPEKEVEYTGQPYLVDEFGGVRWVEVDESRHSSQESWGYGDAPASKEEVYERVAACVDALLSLAHVRGYCYTQLTDIEQEQNGIYNYDRSAKFDMTRIAAIFGKRNGT